MADRVSQLQDALNEVQCTLLFQNDVEIKSRH